MARPASGYHIDGVRIPGTTTILSRFKPAGGLIHWAWEQGRAGLDYRETRDKAADAGTLTHNMVESDIYGVDFDVSKYDPALVSKSMGAFLAYRSWKSQTQMEIAEAEISLVSRKHRFGGTLDALFIQGELAIGDWKTSNAIYGEHILQVGGAYALLWDENFPERPITGGFHILRFSKPDHPDDPVSFCHHFWSNLDLAKRLFLLYREAYDLDQRLSKLL